MSEITKTNFLLTPSHGRTFAADASFLKNDQPKSVIIFVHGFKGFKDWGCWNLLADYFINAGFVFIKLNLSHNGTTPESKDLVDMEAFGRNNFSIELTDLDTLISYLFSEDCGFKAEMDLQKIGIIGHSRGGGLVLLKAAEDDRLKAVATWAAVSNLNPGFSEEIINKWKTEGVIYNLNTRTNMQMPLYYQLYEDFAANKERFNVQIAASKLHQSLLIIHGDQDPVVTLKQANELKKAQPKAELEIIEGANHAFGGGHPWEQNTLPADLQLVAQKTVSFFTKNLNHG